MRTKFQSEDLEVTDKLGDLGVDGCYNVQYWTGLNLLNIRYNGAKKLRVP